jgi:excisionase family DNA binding protein
MELLTVDDVAGVFKVHPETVRRWIRDGCPVSCQLGRAYRLDMKQVLKWLDKEYRNRRRDAGKGN